MARHATTAKVPAKPKVAVDRNAPKMVARNAPASAVNKILDFLMFFNSGTACAYTHEFIYGHLKEHSGFKCTENVTRRYKFYDLTTFLATNKDWTSAAFQDVLDTVTELEAVCVNCPSNAQGKWAAAKMDIVFQIGLAFLRETVDLVGDELPEDPSDLVLPAQISVLAYEDKIEQIFTLQEEVYDTESGEPSDLYETHIRTLTDNITESVAAGAKGKKNAPKKKMLSKQKVYELLSENRLKLVVNQLIHFVQTMETTVLPVPLDVDVREYKEQETVASALKRMSHKPDWTDKEAETAGPYASPRKTRSKPSSSAAAGRADEGEDNFGDDGAQEEEEEEEEVAAPARAKAASGSSSASAVRSPVAKAAPTVAPGSVTAASEKLKRKYDQIDPLLAALGPDSAAAKARVSGEAKLSATKAPAPAAAATSSASKAAAAKAQSPKGSAKSASSAPAPKARKTAVAASKKGEKVVFSDSELEEIDEESSSDSEAGSDYAAEKADRPAVKALLHMKLQAAKSSTKFPARLESPPGKKSAGAASGASSKPKAKKNDGGGGGGKRTKWTFEEEEALTEAVGTYGEGNWAEILGDPEYSRVFANRTNVNLKDKWRNMSK